MNKIVIIMTFFLVSCQDEQSEVLYQMNLTGKYYFDTTISFLQVEDTDNTLSIKETRELILYEDSTFDLIHSVFQSVELPDSFSNPDYFGHWTTNEYFLKLTIEGPIKYHNGKYVRLKKWTEENYFKKELEIKSDKELVYKDLTFRR